MSAITKVEKRVGIERILPLAIAVVAIAMTLYHLVFSQYIMQTPVEHRNTHYSFALVLVFHSSIHESKKKMWLSVSFLLLGLIATIYVKIYYDELQLRAGLPTNIDLVIGTLLLVIGMEATRRAFGLALPLICAILMLYVFLGHMLPPPFWHYRLTFGEIITRFSIGLTGIYGTVLAVSANYIFLFVVFGGILMASGASDLFVEIGKMAGKTLRGGPAMSAVVSSALVGTMVGSAAADVAITGSFTIPLMKSTGYKPHVAAAIEAAASTGGHIMPPIMTGAAFLMAAMLGIPYTQVMVMAIIPSVLYYLFVGLYVEFIARKSHIQAAKQSINRTIVLRTAPQFVIPLGVILGFLVAGFSPMYAGFYAIVSLFIISMVRRDTRQTPGKWIKGIISGAKGGAQIAVASVCCGMIATGFTVTGLAMKVPNLVELWSAGILPIALFMTAIVTTLLGCAMPTMPSYLIVVLLVVPALVSHWGLSPKQAHFFVFFYASFSSITPPVAIASLVAAKMAGADYFKTCVESCKVGISAFILPFIFIAFPAILLEATTVDSVTLFVGFLSTVVSLFLFTTAIVGWAIRVLGSKERLFMGLIGFAFLLNVFTGRFVFFAGGLMGLALFCILHIMRKPITVSKALK